MIKINIICVGKIKERYLLDAINEYLKRLSKYAKVNIIELEDEKVQNHTAIDIQNIESRKILTKIKDDDYLIILDLKGDEYDSIKLASYFQSLEDKGIGNVFIAIGGSIGFNDEIGCIKSFSSHVVYDKGYKSYRFSKMKHIVPF